MRKSKTILECNREVKIDHVKNNIGSFLYDYYLKFGEKKYNFLVERMGKKMNIKYGSTFNAYYLRLMRVEFTKLNEKNNSYNKKTSS